MLIDELIKAKMGNIAASDKIIEHYNYFIYYIMNEYEIINKVDCYDAVVERILKSFYKFDIQSHTFLILVVFINREGQQIYSLSQMNIEKYTTVLIKNAGVI